MKNGHQNHHETHATNRTMQAPPKMFLKVGVTLKEVSSPTSHCIREKQQLKRNLVNKPIGSVHHEHRLNPKTTSQNDVGEL